MKRILQGGLLVLGFFLMGIASCDSTLPPEVIVDAEASPEDPGVDESVEPLPETPISTPEPEPEPDPEPEPPELEFTPTDPEDLEVEIVKPETVLHPDLEALLKGLVKIDTPQELQEAHQVYAESINRELEHVNTKWQTHVEVYPAHLAATIGAYNNFFSFILAADEAPLLVHELSIADWNLQAHEALANQDAQDLLDDLKGLLQETEGMNGRIELAVTAYRLPLEKVKAGDEGFQSLAQGFADGVLNALGSDGCGELCADLETHLIQLLAATTYQYGGPSEDPQYVSFVNFSGWALHPFDGAPGGLGAIATGSVRF